MERVLPISLIKQLYSRRPIQWQIRPVGSNSLSLFLVPRTNAVWVECTNYQGIKPSTASDKLKVFRDSLNNDVQFVVWLKCNVWKVNNEIIRGMRMETEVQWKLQHDIGFTQSAATITGASQGYIYSWGTCNCQQPLDIYRIQSNSRDQQWRINHKSRW